MGILDGAGGTRLAEENDQNWQRNLVQNPSFLKFLLEILFMACIGECNLAKFWLRDSEWPLLPYPRLECTENRHGPFSVHQASRDACNVLEVALVPTKFNHLHEVEWCVSDYITSTLLNLMADLLLEGSGW
jgi:hypothetical protein